MCKYSNVILENLVHTDLKLQSRQQQICCFVSISSFTVLGQWSYVWWPSAVFCFCWVVVFLTHPPFVVDPAIFKGASNWGYSKWGGPTKCPYSTPGTPWICHYHFHSQFYVKFVHAEFDNNIKCMYFI